jgi:glyoxylate/hydroxypyruvate reductase A
MLSGLRKSSKVAIAMVVGRDDEDKKRHEWFIRDWQKALLALDSTIDIRVWPEVGNIDDIDFLLVWNHPIGSLKHFPRVKAIVSLAAGVDHLLVDPELANHIPIIRVVDPFMAKDLVQYVVACVLNYIKRIEHWAAKQNEKTWNKVPPFTFADKTIGIMGLGFLGNKAVHILKQLGLNVIGWSKSAKSLAEVKCFVGEAQFKEFLSETDILICMLPLTKETKNILNQETFSHLHKGAYLINVGRGEQLVEEDLLAALASGQLSGAALDVFRQEPLPRDHPFWTHPKIRITPHIASVTNPRTAAMQILDNYQRLHSGKNLINLIDINKGY